MPAVIPFLIAVLMSPGPASTVQAQDAAEGPVRLGVVGLTHGHVGWILGRTNVGDVEVVGIVEADRALARRYADQYGFDMDLVYATIDELLEATRPEAVAAFNDIASHLETVEAAARRGVHVMVEKPLHFSLAAAERMRTVSDSAGIHLLTNYETTWYPTTARTKEMVDAGEVGVLRKIVVHDGHEGPLEIGVGPEFLGWLTDPARNGGGALVDFGCYGANLITWLMGGARPLAVTAVAQTMKPDVYPEVDDEATIILEYAGAQGIIQASWNWPFSRKDMEVYGTKGLVLAGDANNLHVRSVRGETSGAVMEHRLEPATTPWLTDPFSYLAAVVRGNVDPAGSLSSLDLNMIVVEILDAARRSAREGRTVVLE